MKLIKQLPKLVLNNNLILKKKRFLSMQEAEYYETI